MKKIFAVALAVVMMFAVCVPAFAATITNETAEQAGQGHVYTDTSKIDGAGSYTVSIPAEMPIEWGELESDAYEYSVVSNLRSGYSIKVDVSQNNEVMSTADGQTLAYTLKGDLTAQTESPIVAEGEFVKSVKVAVDADDWAAAPIDMYEDNATFTVTVVEA